MVDFMAEKIVIDAEGAILGRISTFVAKKLMLGDSIVVVNADKIVISGNPMNTKAFYKHRRERTDPHKGPFFPRNSDTLLKRTIRGMLPAKTSRGKDALSRLNVHVGCPSQFSGKAVKPEVKRVNELKCKFMTTGAVCKHLGGKV